MITARILCSFAALLTLDVAAADAEVSSQAPPLAHNPLLEQIRVGLTAADFTADVLAPFDTVAGKNGTITTKALRDRQALEEAMQRSSAIGAVLRYDLDADLHVTTDEIIKVETISAAATHPARTKKTSAKLDCDRVLLQFDINHDGAIDLDEAAQVSLVLDRSERSDPLVALIDTDLGKDGKLTRKELKAFAQLTFAAIDTDKDARISDDEYAAIAHARFTPAS